LRIRSCEASALLVEVWLFFLFHTVAAEEIGQVLREGGARHDRVATGFDGLGLEISLQMRQEADDGGVALELGLELGDQGQWLGVRVVRSKTMRPGRSSSSPAVRAAMASFSFLTKATLTPSLRAVSWIFAMKNRSSMKKKILVGAFSGMGMGRPCE